VSEIGADVALLLPDMRGGGAERVNLNLANEFARMGLRVDMLLIQAVGELLPLLDPSVRVLELGGGRFRMAIRPLTRYLRDRPPASMLANMWPLSAAAVGLAWLCRATTRVVVVEHNAWLASERSHEALHRATLRVSARLVFPLAAGVVAVSQGAASDVVALSGLPAARVSVIPNPLVGGHRAAAGETLAPEWSTGHHRKILAVGALKEIKDYPTLLRAFARLVQTVDARLLVLGEGEQRMALAELARDIGIADRVTFPGFSTTPERYFREADLCVMSSTGEGFGNVLVEALAVGTPVVSTDCPHGPREILGDGAYGMLVPVGDPEQLASAMAASLGQQHDAQRLIDRASMYSVAGAAASYLDLLLPGRQPESPPASDSAVIP
jgi:glycosyltransferase involved in cell wall biosynthesis